MTLSQYQRVTNWIIENLEGGYYHPDMSKQFPQKFAAYKNSGETMFGLDRHAGHDLYYSTPRKFSDVFTNLPLYYNGSYKYRSINAQQFWSTIDNLKARTNWQWNYKGGQFRELLQDLAGSIMFDQYKKLAEKYLTEKSRKIIENDQFLMTNFAYAVWNGSGRFKGYAEKFNEAVNGGVTDPVKLGAYMVNLRTQSSNPIIKAQGLKLKTLYEDLHKTNINLVLPVVIFLLIWLLNRNM